MLSEFVTTYRAEIVARTRERVRTRTWPSVSSRELEHGVPLFLLQLSETLRSETPSDLLPGNAVGYTATRRGAELLAAGFNVSQVVHDYGDICQAITEIAGERQIPITVEEFRTLNHCLDTAIADAVTEYTRLTAARRSEEELERLGQTAHELRDLLNSALLAFHVLKRGTVAINGTTGAVLGRSLTGLRDLVDRTLSEVRLAAGKQLHERLSVTTFVDEIAATGMLHSEYRGVRFRVVPVDPALVIDGDRQLLSSAVMNVLQNAFRHTPLAGTVTLTARTEGTRLQIAVEDECGGLAPDNGDLFHAFSGPSGNRSGLGLGLSIARQAVRAHGGDIHVRNLPGQGCVFTIDLPLAQEPAGVFLPS